MAVRQGAAYRARMRVARLLIPTAVVVVAVSAVTYAATSSGDTVNGCVTSAGKSKGELRVITGSQKCSKSETAISWSKTGPAGADGAKGDTGATGAQGPAGPAGPAGATGSAATTVGGAALTDGKADLYLKLQLKRAGIVKGDSTDPDHPSWIVLRSAHMSVEGATAIGGSATTRRTYGPFELTKLADPSTTAIMSALATNDEIKSATIAERRPGESFDAITYVLSGARVTAFEQGGRQEPPLFDQFSIAFTKIEVDYRKAGDGPGTVYSFSDEVTPVS